MQLGNLCKCKIEKKIDIIGNKPFYNINIWDTGSKSLRNIDLKILFILISNQIT